jgi:hypothetical protein
MANTRNLLAATDQTLASIHVRDFEGFVQDNLQDGGQ